MKKEDENKAIEFRTLTFRLSDDLYQRCVKKTIEQSVQRGKIIKISEFVRESMEQMLNN